MGFFSKLFGNKENKQNKSDQTHANVRSRNENPDVYDVKDENDRMNWGIQKANLTLQYFEDCLNNPKPNQSYFSIKVKIVDNGMVEHIWLSEPHFDDDGNLFGTIGNEPIDVTNVKLGQKIGIERKLISDWMIIDGGRLIGGYTIRAIREGLTGQALVNFDKSLGGMHVDEGEDHFLPNLDTPEGAILKLENAYDQRNLEIAISCKDFDEEAKMMLKKLGKIESDHEIVKKTAEVLKLSFLKSLQENGLPSFKGVKRAFPKREKVSDQHYIITEVCFFPDGSKSVQKLNTYKTETGWKVLSPEN